LEQDLTDLASISPPHELHRSQSLGSGPQILLSPTSASDAETESARASHFENAGCFDDRPQVIAVSELADVAAPDWITVNRS
jgi:hypothetical protein